MKFDSFITDRYTREARLAPALLVALPEVLMIFVWFPQLRTLGAGFLALFCTCGGILWLAHLARDRGVALQPKLYQVWGGQPSTCILRYQDNELTEPVKARYRACLQGHLPDLVFPSKHKEYLNPKVADVIYEAAGSWLLTHTRDKSEFPLVFEENVNYGFRRNLWAMKPIAVFAGLVCFIGSTTSIGVNWYRSGTTPSIETVIVTAFVAVYVMMFLFFIHPRWVKVPAIAFARQLLAACDLLPPSGIDRLQSGEEGNHG